jgi:glycosyltransferase involved in cell wall biosynthesis
MLKENKHPPLISILIPVYNERNTIESLITQVHGSGVSNLEVVVVDDGSQDGTQEVLQSLEKKKKIHRLILHERNQGKGAALRTGIAKVTGEIVIIQDADLEYDPRDYLRLIQPIIEDRADVVYGSRFVGSYPHRVVFFWHSLANHTLTLLSNIFNNLNLTDMETGYKVFRRSILQKIHITENSFGIEPEITAKVAAQRVRIYEIGISYYGRTYEEGKKIGLKDALRAVWVIAKFGLLCRLEK